MVKWYTHNYNYNESWSTVTLAFFLRYPNPYASHVLSADVISRSITPEGSLQTKRLILKRGAVPKWLPRGIVSRAESWIIEESEVDPFGKVVRCETRNLDHVKIMSVRENMVMKETSPGNTNQTTQATVVSNFGWGLARRIERYGQEKFQRNIERSRAGISLILDLIQQSRLQTLPYGADVGAYPSPQGTGTIFDSFRPRLYSSRSSSPDPTSSSSYSSPSTSEPSVTSVDNADSPRARKWSDVIPRSSLLGWFTPRSYSSPTSSSTPSSHTLTTTTSPPPSSDIDDSRSTS